MTTGALIFAFNNEKTNYVKLAAWSAARIRDWLQIPVAVVTNCTEDLGNQFDKVIMAAPETGGYRYFADYDSTVTWHNAGRTDAYALTPWDQTLVLDADYVVCSNQLSQVLNASQEFLAFRHSYNLARPDIEFLPSFGRHRFPMWWATVMMFKKSTTAEYIFDSMNMIKANWQHYKDLYGITEKNYRNDYALSIALGLVSGHTLKVDSIPWKMAATMPEHVLSKQLAGDAELWRIDYRDTQNKLKTLGIAGQDFHAMGKGHLEAVIEAA